MPPRSKPTWPYLTVGNVQNPKLLLLHGFMGSGLDWLEIAELLSNDFCSILVDLPGHGKNIQLPVAEAFSLRVLSAGLGAFLDQCAIQNISVLGYSMGGRIALQFALDFPEKVTNLILESTHPGIADTDLRAQRRLLDKQRAAALDSAGLDAFVENWYDMPIFQSLHRHPAKLAALKIQRKRNQAAWISKLIVELSPGHQVPLWDRMVELGMPVLLLAGRDDKKYLDITSKMVDTLAGAQQVCIPEAGHVTHWEQPKNFSDIVSHFLLAESP